MENKVILERLNRLRGVMAERHIDFVLMPTADYHNSEYVNDFFKVREFFCNFSGSNGTLVVWQEGAGLWTDGRYFIQAEHELAGTGVTLMRMQEESVPTIEEFLTDSMKEGQCLAFDGRCVSVRSGRRYEEIAAKKKGYIADTLDPAEGIWTDRPAFPVGKVAELSDEITGKNTLEKLTELRKAVVSKGADAVFISKLDDLMWLFNVRGSDVECNPVGMSYGYVSRTDAVIFLQAQAVTRKVREYFDKHGIIVEEYHDVLDYLRKLPEGQKILLDERYTSYSVHKILSGNRQIVRGENPTEQMKAVKNPTELANMRDAYLQDSAAVTKFIHWLKTSVGEEEITEITAADYLEKMRRQIPGFRDLSFPTIAAYNANAAMAHYQATPESFAVLKPEGLLLVDSGGQYMGGTTDITRTIALGELSDEVRKHYTLVAAGMLQLMNAKWLYGCTGRNLDLLARQPIWDEGLDYKHGTGHGVGYLLNVHEGPQNMRWKFTEGMTESVLEAGMDITDEPGIYIEGSHGIRIENVLVACNGDKNEYGQFMYFENLTYAPIDLDAIDTKYLSQTQRKLLNEYHRQVREKLAPYLSGEVNEWLEKVTAEV